MASHLRPAAVSVVTGASRGLGAALATELLERNHEVAVCARAAPALGGALCRSVDVTDPRAVEAFADEVASTLGPIDVWINNAAVIGPIGLMLEVEPSRWRECLDINILGTVHGSRAFLTRCSADGRLINISSRAGATGVAGLAAYSASKAAVIALTESIAAEHPGGASVHVVLPPSTDTAMQRELLAQDEGRFPGVADSRKRQDRGEILSATDAARAILRSVLDVMPTGTVVDLTQPAR